MADFPAIDARHFRNALGHFASGVTVITGIAAGEPVGFTCQSFYSVSLHPPLVSFCVRKQSASWPRIRPTGRFAVNILNCGQSALSAAFAQSADDRWAGVDWTQSDLGNPILAGVLLAVECTVHAEHDAGDHQVILGNVLQLTERHIDPPMGPLIYYRGEYRQLSRHRPE